MLTSSLDGSHVNLSIESFFVSGKVAELGNGVENHAKPRKLRFHPRENPKQQLKTTRGPWAPNMRFTFIPLAWYIYLQTLSQAIMGRLGGRLGNILGLGHAKPALDPA